MFLSKSYYKISPLSKAVALIFFIVLFFLGFYIGRWYQGVIVVPDTRLSSSTPNGKGSDQILSEEFYIGPRPYRLLNRYFDDSQDAKIILKDTFDQTEYVLGDGFYGYSILSVTRSEDNKHVIIGYSAGDGQFFQLLGVKTSQDETKIDSTILAQDLRVIPEISDNMVHLVQILSWIDSDHILVREKSYPFTSDKFTTKYWNIQVSNPQNRKTVTF